MTKVFSGCYFPELLKIKTKKAVYECDDDDDNNG